MPSCSSRTAGHCCHKIGYIVDAAKAAQMGCAADPGVPIREFLSLQFFGRTRVLAPWRAQHLPIIADLEKLTGVAVRRIHGNKGLSRSQSLDYRPRPRCQKGCPPRDGDAKPAIRPIEGDHRVGRNHRKGPRRRPDQRRSSRRLQLQLSKTFFSDDCLCVRLGCGNGGSLRLPASAEKRHGT
jgi:hypothetical protein